MSEAIEIPVELTQFQLSQAEGWVELAEFLSLLSLRSTRVIKST